MLISAVNFGLHFIAFSKRNPSVYSFDSETKFFSWMILFAVAITCTTLVVMETLPLEKAIVHGLFQTVSIATTTGFSSDNFSIWPSFLPIFLIMLSVMGACAGSTGGGMKAMRILLIFRQGMRELRQLLHPNAVIPLKARSSTGTPGRGQCGMELLCRLHVLFIYFGAVHASEPASTFYRLSARSWQPLII